MSASADPGGGEGWLECALDHLHWGRYGAAGVLIYRRRNIDDARGEVLLQHRAEWSHHGGTWGVLGGARHCAERAVDAALREAHEEATLTGTLMVDGLHDDDHGTWTYSTVLAEASGDLTAAAAGRESLAVAWWPAEDVAALPLHPGFAVTWPLLRTAVHPWHVVVDAANVVGSRPDSWWRDRAAGARRLVEQCTSLAGTGIPRAALHGVRPDEVLDHRWPRWTVVVEGAAKAVAAPTGAPVRVVAAPGSGDDAIVDEVVGLRGSPVLVVTADRELRARVVQAGATTCGPRWLLGLPVT